MIETAATMQESACTNESSPTAGDDVVELRLAYLTTEYPKASHTFIRREILELERCDVPIQRIAIRDSGGVIADAVDRDEAERTFVCLKQPKITFLRATAATLLGRPAKFFKALRTTLHMGRVSDRGILRHLAYLVEACLLARHLHESNIDHVHVHFGTNAAAVARLIRVLGGPSYSMTVHGPDEFDAPRGFSLGEKVVDSEFVCAISDFCAAQLRRWTPFEQWSKIHVVHCSVDDSFLAAPEPVSADSNLFLSIGRLSAQKGQLLLVEALAELIRDGHDVQLVLAGDGELRPELEARIRELECGDNVTITGYVDEQRIRRLLQECRALVQPSFAEGLPVVIMEAFAMGRPVVASCINGIPELVRDGENGWLITAGNVRAITDSMRAVLDADGQRLSSMGLAGRERVLADHRCVTEAEKLLDLLRSVAKRRSLEQS